jgi:hypothetical protein
MTEKDPLKEIQKAYRLVFGTEPAKDVLADLRIFCNATKTTAPTSKIDPYQMAIQEGRRQVFLHILTYIKVDIEDVYDYDLNL